MRAHKPVRSLLVAYISNARTWLLHATSAQHRRRHFPTLEPNEKLIVSRIAPLRLALIVTCKHWTLHKYNVSSKALHREHAAASRRHNDDVRSTCAASSSYPGEDKNCGWLDAARTALRAASHAHTYIASMHKHACLYPSHHTLIYMPYTYTHALTNNLRTRKLAEISAMTIHTKLIIEASWLLYHLARIRKLDHYCMTCTFPPK